MKYLATIFALLYCSAAVSADDALSPEAVAFFEKQVRPILVEHCYKCHGPKEQEGSLRVDHITHLKKGGDRGPAIVASKLDESVLISAVRYTDADLQMPPDGQLAAAEIAVLEKWVQLGAPWPNEGTPQIALDEHGFTAEDRQYWFFQPLAEVSPPIVESRWVRNDIDHFIAAKHAEFGLAPAAEADRREFIRRVYFDLHGLPPSPADIAAFVNDPDPQAHEKLIDRLLDSPRYGERWAQHWLDLVRYAESDGYNADGYRDAVWPYRDYVIRSFNDDKPYDQFVREQLAGDQIAPDDPNVLIATAYLRHPVYEWNQRDVRGQWELIVTDMTDTTGEVFLGLSFGCARCHNHKFDPILQKDYYRLKAFFTPVHWRDDVKLGTPSQIAEYTGKQAAWEAATAEIRAQMDELIAPLLEPRVERALTRFTDDLQELVRKSPEERDALARQLAGLCERQMVHERRTFDPAKTLKDEAAKKKYAELEAELKKFDVLKPKPLPDAFVATDATSVAPPNVMKTRQGEEDVAPGFLTILEPREPAIPLLANSTGRRLALANWITRPENSLATRVIVNRLWQYHFGRGIVATASDFGRLGEKPSHPELLDWLARRFVDGGWRLKPLHREILLSATYRQTARREPSGVAAEMDPTNKFLWRFSPRRLDAEQVRDAMLVASGELDFKAGGPAEDAVSSRRSIYTRKKRNNPNELLRSLDAPTGFSSTPERQSTTTPTQALLLINGDWTLDRARKLAQRSKNIAEAWICALGREPTDRELASAEAFLKKRAAGGGDLIVESDAAPVEAGRFQPNSAQERLVATLPEKEGDEFTIEAVFQLDSIDANSSPRTIASRWNGAKDSQEAFGWCLGVTGKKSRFTPQSLIVQLVGEDENANIGYEVAASHLRIELGRTYYVAVNVSCAARTVKFHVQDLSQPTAAAKTAVAQHVIRGHLSDGQSSLVLGGLSKRSLAHQWDGRIDAVRIVRGESATASPTPKFEEWTPGLVHWTAGSASSAFTWTGAASPSVEAGSPLGQAMIDLCQVLLNCNEFFYLH